MFAGLAKGRFDQLVSSPSVNTTAHIKTSMLLGLLQGLNWTWGYLCIRVFSSAGISELMLLMFEIMVVAIDVTHTIGKLVDM